MSSLNFIKDLTYDRSDKISNNYMNELYYNNYNYQTN